MWHAVRRVSTEVFGEKGLVIHLQGKLDELETELTEINGNSERLQKSHSELMELQLVLEKAGGFFDDAQHRASAAQFESEPSSPTYSKLSMHVTSRFTCGPRCRQMLCWSCAHTA